MRAVLFDMDGVLVRSEEVWFRLVEAAGVRFRGRAITREEFFPTFGQGTATDIPVFGLNCTVDELNAYYTTEFVRFLDSVWVNPEARVLLDELASRQVKVALVTNTVGPLAARILEYAKLDRDFVVRATADVVKRSKPAPDLLHYALEGLGVAAGDALMVGDSRFDREAAHAAGVRFAGLKLDGDVRVERLLELPIVLGWRQGPRLRPARAGDLEAVRALVSSRGLPLDGLEAQFPSAFGVAEVDGRVVGVAALERYGFDGLLRSVAVEERSARAGLGVALVEDRLAEARKQGLASVSLLTTTARPFFERRGFKVASRSVAPSVLVGTVEFTGACPASAAYLHWHP